MMFATNLPAAEGAGREERWEGRKWAPPPASLPPQFGAAERPQPAAVDGALGAPACARAAGPTSVGFASTLLDFGLPPAPSSWRKAARIDGSGERAEKRALVRDS